MVFKIALLAIKMHLMSKLNITNKAKCICKDIFFIITITLGLTVTHYKGNSSEIRLYMVE